MTLFFYSPPSDDAYIRVWRDVSSNQFVLMDRSEWKKFWSQIVQLQNIGFDIKLQSVSLTSGQPVLQPNSGVINSEPPKQTLLG